MYAHAHIFRLRFLYTLAEAEVYNRHLQRFTAPICRALREVYNLTSRWLGRRFTTAVCRGFKHVLD
jgi:hypothetical protein